MRRNCSLHVQGAFTWQSQKISNYPPLLLLLLHIESLQKTPCGGGGGGGDVFVLDISRVPF